MGSGGSKKPTEVATDANNNDQKEKVRDAVPELKEEPEIEDVDVPLEEPGYPLPRPPHNKKKDIFILDKMKKIDDLARNAPAEKSKDYTELIKYLTVRCKSDVEKVRAIFVWMGSQDIDDGIYEDATDSDTPLGFMKLMKDSRATYSSFFALLCRKAGIPCVTIKGYAKSAGYEVGDEDDDVKLLNNSWNAVYVSGGWRLVFPLWACTAVSGYSSGIYTKVETKGQAVREKEQQSSGKHIRIFNEYYFLTDPEDFIYIAFPKETKWQLISRQWTFQKFADVPHCRQYYFIEHMSVLSKLTSRVHTQNGMCVIEVGCEDPTGMAFDYELYFNDKESEKTISSSLQLNNFVMMVRSESKWAFMVRFPEVGVYKFQVVGGRHGYETDLCAFKVFADEVKEDVRPYPINPGAIGYGPNADTERAGLKAVSHQTAIVQVTARKHFAFNFKLTKNIQVNTELINENISKEELSKYVKTTQSDRKLHVDVMIPEAGEYALAMHAQQKGQSGYENVCNYLLTSEKDKKKKSRIWETPTEKKTRTALQTMSKSKSTRNIDDLEKQLARFERLDLDDNGDLSAGYDALEYKKIKKELEDAIKRRHLETLERAIHQGYESRFREKVANQITEAEEVRDHLKYLDRIAHDILEMKQPTISEIKSYKYPPRIVEDIMRSTFLMLGVRPVWIDEWTEIQVMMGKTGKESLLRKVKEFDTVNVTPEARAHADKTLSEHTETDARVASAGAGTFYVWLRNVTEAIDGQNDREDIQENEEAVMQEEPEPDKNKSTSRKKK
ncbi:hypothetical protein ACF0H5_012902 [Mactra antiquata]